MKILLLSLFGFVMAQPINVPPADTRNTLFVTVFDKTELSEMQLGDDTHLILELSQKDPERFYKYEHWHYEQKDREQHLTRNGEEQILDEARLEWLQGLLEKTLNLHKKKMYFLNVDMFNNDLRWFFEADEASFTSLALWQENTFLESWYADPIIDGVDGYTQNDARLDTLLARHFAGHKLISSLTIEDFASELPQYFEISRDIELGLLLASQSLEADSAFEVWREVQDFSELESR